MSMELLVMQHLLEDHRLPQYVIERVMKALREGESHRLNAIMLQHRIEQLEQHVPEEIRNPKPQRYMGSYVKRTGD